MTSAIRRAAGSLLLLPLLAAAPVPREVAVLIPSGGGLQLAGTLALPPTTTRPVAALVLVAGSGPTDRNGNQPPELISDLLRTLAGELARRGIATLRYDKRGQHANAAQAPADPHVLAEFCAWDRYVGDVTAAVAFLRGRAEVDPARVGILGHSEGGLLALAAASALSRAGRPPAALVLLATPGRPVDVGIAEQLDRSLRTQRLPSALIRYVLAQNADVTRSVRQTGRLPAAGVSVWLTPIYPPYIAPFLHGELAVDPPALARGFAGPVLLVNGTADVQVSAERDAAALDVALARRTPDIHRLLLLPRCSHELKPVHSDAEAGVTGDVSAAGLRAIGDWAVDHL